MNRKIHPQYTLLQAIKGLEGVRKAENHMHKPGVIHIYLSPSRGYMGGRGVEPIFKVLHKGKPTIVFNIPDMKRIALSIRDAWEETDWGVSVDLDIPSIIQDDENRKIAGYTSDMLTLHVREA